MEESNAEQDNRLLSHVNTLKTNLLQWLSMLDAHKTELEELEEHYVHLAVEQQAYCDMFQKLKEGGK